MKIGVTGGSGQVGSEIVRLAKTRGFEVSAPSSSQVDLSRDRDVADWLAAAACDLVVNCAAYTAVDAAETDAEAAYGINAEGVARLAGAAAGSGVRMIQLSTDYVFDGQTARPYCEDAAPAPAGVYGASKLAGEQAVLAAGGEAAILRVSWVFGRTGHNFVKAILRRAASQGELSVVDDQVGAPCFARSIARPVLAMAEVDAWPRRLYHFGARPLTTWHGFACEIVTRARALGLLARDVPIAEISTAALNLPAPRPAFSGLDPSRFEADFAHAASDWRLELQQVLEELLDNGFGTGE